MLGWQEWFRDARDGADSLLRTDSFLPAQVQTIAQKEMQVETGVTEYYFFFFSSS